MFSQNAPDTANNNWTVSPKLSDDSYIINVWVVCKENRGYNSE